jgi:hypothetical protein
MFGNKDNQEDGIKAQTFEISARRGIGALQRKIRKWLAANPDVEIISTDFAGFGDNIGYVILFRGHEVIVQDSPESEQQLADSRLDVRFDEEQSASRLQMQVAQSPGRIINQQFEQPSATPRQTHQHTQLQQQAVPQFQTAQQGQPVFQTAAIPEVDQGAQHQKPFRLGPGKTPTQRPIQQPPQPERIAAEPPQPIAQQDRPQDSANHTAGVPRRSGFTTSAVFGDYDAFKPEE